jgi:hypothetical protein
MRSIFVGTGAYVGRVDGVTRLAFWAEEPIDHDFDPSRLISVDLSRTPNAAAAREISWDAVEVDDCAVGTHGRLEGTTVGPRWPEMQLVGAVYLEESVVRRLPPAARPPCPPTGMGGRGYEFKRVVYWSHGVDPRAGRRYIGHHAEILEESGKLARVAVFKSGMSDRPDAVATTMWIDLSSPDECDAGPDSLTRIAVGSGAKKGALFLAAGRVVDGRADSAGTESAGPGNPKFPRFSGEDGEPGASAPKIPPLQSVDGAADWTGPKLPPGDGESGAAGMSSPKLPPMAGEISAASVSAPEIPPLSGESRVGWPSGPKLPPAESDESVAGLRGPKLPPWEGEGATAGASSPKLPPMQRAQEMPGVSSPKFPLLQNEGNAADVRGPKLPPFQGAQEMPGVSSPKLPPLQNEGNAADVRGPKLPPYSGDRSAAISHGPKLPPYCGEGIAPGPNLPKLPPGQGE